MVCSNGRRTNFWETGDFSSTKITHLTTINLIPLLTHLSRGHPTNHPLSSLWSTLSRIQMMRWLLVSHHTYFLYVEDSVNSRFSSNAISSLSIGDERLWVSVWKQNWTPWELFGALQYFSLFPLHNYKLTKLILSKNTLRNVSSPSESSASLLLPKLFNFFSSYSSAFNDFFFSRSSLTTNTKYKYGIQC